MRFRVIVEYEYPVEHKIPVKAELVLHGDRVASETILPLPKDNAVLNGKPYEERKTSRWKLTDSRNSYTVYECEKCGRDITVFHRFCGEPSVADVTVEYPYCHCGAKMEVEE